MGMWKYKCRSCGEIYKTEKSESCTHFEKTLIGLCPKHQKKTRPTKKKKEVADNKKVDKLVKTLTDLNK